MFAAVGVGGDSLGKAQWLEHLRELHAGGSLLFHGFLVTKWRSNFRS